MGPAVSVIVPCFNGAQYLTEAVDSVLAQTFTDLECIIVDDGSTDNTRQVSESLMSRDSRVRYLFKEHSGLYPTRNFAIRHSEGEWIQFLDADDWLHKDKIGFQLGHLNGVGCGDDVVFYSDYEIVHQDDDGNVVERVPHIVGKLSNEQLLDRTTTRYLKGTSAPLHINSTLFKRTVFRRKMFDESFEAYGDQEFLVDLLLKDILFVYTPIFGMYYRRHRSNMSRDVPLIRDAYVQYLEAIYKKDRSLLRRNPNVPKLVQAAFMQKDRDKFNRLIRLIDLEQMPVGLPDGRIKIRSKFILRLAFGARLLVPISIQRAVRRLSS